MRFCNHPFHTLHVLNKATLYPYPHYMTCCGSWFTNHNDMIVKGDFKNLWDMWNHEIFQKLRSSWLSSDSRLCLNCPVLSSAPKHVQHKDSYMTPVMQEGPRYITFANDQTCNLHCWTCRIRPIIDKNQQVVFDQTNSVLDTFKDSITWIECIGSGDPFASPAWRKILQQLDPSLYNDLSIEIFTNGILIPRYWDSIKNIHSNIKNIKVSIDAATEETYNKTRLGSTFSQLTDAMQFVSKLGKEIHVNMVVQQDNFREIPLFIEQAFDIYGASFVNLTMMGFWGRTDRKLFESKDISNKDHPMYHEFLTTVQENLDIILDTRVNSVEVIRATNLHI